MPPSPKTSTASPGGSDRRSDSTTRRSPRSSSIGPSSGSASAAPRRSRSGECPSRASPPQPAPTYPREVWGGDVHTLGRTPAGWRCLGMTFRVVHARGNELVHAFVPRRRPRPVGGRRPARSALDRHGRTDDDRPSGIRGRAVGRRSRRDRRRRCSSAGRCSPFCRHRRLGATWTRGRPVRRPRSPFAASPKPRRRPTGAGGRVAAAHFLPRSCGWLRTASAARCGKMARGEAGGVVRRLRIALTLPPGARLRRSTPSPAFS